MGSTDEILLDTILRFFSEDPVDRPLGVAYSGGRDSGVLLWALVRALGPQRLVALHVDHGWRPPDERAEEAALVARWCGALGVDLVRFPPPSEVVKTEAAARAHRYACFRSFVDQTPGAGVVLAHHADDQAETVLMRLLRGRSWQGLGGMSARRGPFLRPLLALRASVLAEVAGNHAIPFHEDSTNGDSGPDRNFLRNQVLPLVSSRFSRAVPALNEFADLWSEGPWSRDPDPGWVRGPRGAVVSAPVWDRWSPLRRQAELLAVTNQVGPGEILGRRFLEEVCSTGRKGTARAKGWTWLRSAGLVHWEKVAPGPQKEYFIRAVQGRDHHLGTYRFHWAVDAGDLRVPGIDPDRTWVWRSGAPGLRLSSVDDADWGRDKRRHRLGGLDPDRLAFLLQDGLVRAVVDPRARRLVWAESVDEKLHKRGIFVTLVTVTPISTE